MRILSTETFLFLCRSVRSVGVSRSNKLGCLAHSILVFICFVIDDIEESQLVMTPTGADDAQPIPKLLLLEKFLGAKEGGQSHL